MTNKEAERWAHVVRAIGPEGYGISREDVEALRRIEMTLRRWAERECNGEVEVDDEGTAWRLHHTYTNHRGRTANLEAGALRRLSAIMARYPHLRAYHQGDPRGCALYVYRADDMGDLDPDAYYSSRGVAICR